MDPLTRPAAQEQPTHHAPVTTPGTAQDSTEPTTAPSIHVSHAGATLTGMEIPELAAPKGSESEPTPHKRAARRTCPTPATATDKAGTPMEPTPITSTSPVSSDSNAPPPGPGGNWDNASGRADTGRTDREATLLEFPPPVMSISTAPEAASSLPAERVVEPNDRGGHAGDVEMGTGSPGIDDRGTAPATGRTPEAA
jgi:hypothetical protein